MTKHGQVTAEVDSGPDWGRRALWVGSVVLVLVIAGFIASATVPRWWAHRVGSQVDGSITQGTLLGLVYGFVFTLLPIALLVLVLRWRRTTKTVVFVVLAALLLASPNLMTLGIVIGRGGAAHAGDRVLDVEAPAFRGGTLGGALLAILFVAFVFYLVVSRDRARSGAHEARSQLEDATTSPPEE